MGEKIADIVAENLSVDKSEPPQGHDLDVLGVLVKQWQSSAVLV